MEWARLRDSARAGEFSPDAWIWTPGYGSEWRRASTLGESLFPKKPAEAAADGGGQGGASAAPAAPAPEEAPEAGADPAGADPAPRERSPFDSSAGDEKPAPPVVGRSFAVAVANMRVILFKPAFSFARFAAFALPAMMLWIGFSTGGAALPGTGPGTEAQSARLARLGLDSVAAPLSGFLEKHASDMSSPLGVADPEGVMRDMAEAFRASSAALVDWAGASGHAALAAAAAVAGLAFCALSAWFLSRGWALLLRRVYRRDEPVGISWVAAAVPAAALFRGTVAVRAAFAAAEAAVALRAVRFFAALPEGGARARHAAAFVFAVCAVQLFGAVATGFVRDFVAPRVALRRVPFFRALREAAGAAGWWFPRYLLMMVPMSVAAQSAAALFVLSLFGVFGNPASLSPMFSVAFSFCVVPWHLVRCLWSLDIAFSVDPALRSATPPGPPAPRVRPAGGRGRYDRGLGGDGA